MTTYYLSHWTRQGESNITIDAENIPDLYDKLIEKYGEANLNGHNYEYITNASHFLAAGYFPFRNDMTISQAKSPAHFNQDFFYIVGHWTKLSS